MFYVWYFPNNYSCRTIQGWKINHTQPSFYHYTKKVITNYRLTILINNPPINNNQTNRWRYLQVTNQEQTTSLCPTCYNKKHIRKVDAQIIKENNKIWITKKCPQHGTIKDLLSNDPKHYTKWFSYKKTGKNNPDINTQLPDGTKLYLYIIPDVKVSIRIIDAALSW